MIAMTKRKGNIYVQLGLALITGMTAGVATYKIEELFRGYNPGNSALQEQGMLYEEPRIQATPAPHPQEATTSQPETRPARVIYSDDFIRSLGARYCPVGASNDQEGLNSNWAGNVTRLYRGFVDGRAFRFPEEEEIIRSTAGRYGIEPEILFAIREAENGSEGLQFGIINTPAYRADAMVRRGVDQPRPYINELERQASWAAASVNAALRRHQNR